MSSQSKDNTCPACGTTDNPCKEHGQRVFFPYSGQQEDKPTITKEQFVEQVKPYTAAKEKQAYLGGYARGYFDSEHNRPNKFTDSKPEKPVMDEQLRGLPPVRRWLNDAYQYGLEANGHNEDLANIALNDIADRANKVLEALLATEYDRGKVETIDKIIAETWDNPEFDHHSSSAWGDYLMKLKEGSKDAQA